MRDLFLVTFDVVEHPRYKEAINRHQPLFPLLSFLCSLSFSFISSYAHVPHCCLLVCLTSKLKFSKARNGRRLNQVFFPAVFIPLDYLRLLSSSGALYAILPAAAVSQL